MALRFKQGELAVYVIPAVPEAQWAVGSIVTVMHVGPFKAGEMFNGRIFPDPCDYLIDLPRYGPAMANDYQLRKIDPPEEPKSLTRDSELPEEMHA